MSFIKKFSMLPMSILFLIVLSSCFSVINYHFETDFEFYDTHYIHVGDIIEIDFDYLSKNYEFDKIEYETYIDSQAAPGQKIKINRLNQPVAFEEGVVSLDALLYEKNSAVVKIHYGNFIISKNDELTADFIGLNSNNIAYYLTQFPNGNYYLANDIDTYQVNRGEIELPIESFSGVLINPYGHKISWFNSTDNFFTGFFKRLDKARIDGLIFDEVDLFFGPYEGNQSTVVGVLAGEAKDSFITNISVEGSIESTQTLKYVGGIVGDSIDTIYRGVSFTGFMNCYALNIGGITGNAISPINRELFGEIYGSTKLMSEPFYMVDRAFVVANLTNHLGREYIASAIGTRNSILMNIRNFYYHGLHNDSNEIEFTFFMSEDHSRYTRANQPHQIYTTMIKSSSTYSFFQVRVTHEQLISGDEVRDLEGFIYEDGKYPVLEKWIKP